MNNKSEELFAQEENVWTSKEWKHQQQEQTITFCKSKGRSLHLLLVFLDRVFISF